MRRNLQPEQLSEIRRNTDWRALFIGLAIVKDPQRSTPGDWWGKSPFNPTERTASFHMGDKGWYCHSTGQGGGPIELIQKLKGLNCFEAGRWLVDQGLSTLQGDTRTKTRDVTQSGEERPREEAVKEELEKRNVPIRQDLTPLLSLDHPEFQRRGIPESVLRELGIGYLPETSKAKSPLKGQIVFQIRGVRPKEDGALYPVILSHMGRVVMEEDKERNGKWHFYKGFHSGQELYNLDKLLLDEWAVEQTQKTGHVLIVEGCFDVAKLYGAEIRNVTATFGCHLTDDQLPQVKLIADTLGVRRFLVFYDRDQDGKEQNGQGGVHTLEKLQEAGYEAEGFNWNQKFKDRTRGIIPIPPSITDPCEFSLDQLRWLREKGRL